MFPFLAPIKQPNHVEKQGTVRFVCEITYLADSPYASRSNSVASAVQLPIIADDNLSTKSRSSEGLNVATSSRPSSRAKSKTSVSSQPTSARSDKSSPVPLKEVVPPPSRYRNKGLELSSAMMELFGGGSSFGAGSAFDHIPAQPEEKNFHRKNMLGREFEQSPNPQRANVPGSSQSAYSTVENHEKAYERAINRSKGIDLSRPGPEWYEGFEQLDMTDIELPPDPNCPAEKLLRSQKEQSNLFETKEDTSKQSPSSSKKFSAYESLPGPDIGAGVEDEEEEEGRMEEQEEEASIEVDSPTADEESPKKDRPSDERDNTNRGDSRDGETNREGRDTEEEDAGGSSNSKTDRAGATDKQTGGAGGMAPVLVIRNAQIINDDAIFTADVVIQDGIISNVGPNIDIPDGAEVIDAAGKMLLPAGIDVHTQITDPDSCDDVATGCKCALAGGTATVVEVITPKSGESPIAAFTRVKGALERALCNVSISVVINNWNESIKSEMEKLVADGVNSFVAELDSDDKIFQLLEHSRKLGSFVRVLPENKAIVAVLEKKMLALGITGPEGYPQSRPEELEADRVNNVCVMSQLANCPVSIISVSSGESLQSIEKARCNGTLAHAEIASAAVASDGSAYLNTDLKQAAAHLTNVPLRKAASDRLVSALSSQPMVVCTSGHKSIGSNARLAAKDFVGMPKGSAGAEERMAIVWEKAVRSGKIDPMRFVAVTSTNAAKVFNMYPKKGRIAVGADADLVIWDASAKRNLSAASGQTSSDVSLFDGIGVHSAVVATIVGGKVAWKDGAAKEKAGGFLALSPNSPYLFSMVSQRDKFGCVEKVERESATKTAQNGHTQPAKDFDRDRNRKHLMESSIDFGGSSNRTRKPSGGRSTGFW